MLALEVLGFNKRPVRSNSPLPGLSKYGGNIVGGALVGSGMALTGACPGTVLPQIAQGVPSAKTVALGCLLGGMAYSLLAPSLQTKIQTSFGPATPTTIPQKLHVPQSAVYLALAMGLIGSLAYGFFGPFGIRPSLGGVAIGLSQAVSFFLTSGPLGVSSGYENAGQYMLQIVRSARTHIQWPSPPRSLSFIMALAAGSIIAASTRLVEINVVGLQELPSLQALLGGFLLVFGARTAGGCTSGHGLSGMGALSFSSLLTVAVMFTAGLSLRMVMLTRA
jgi:uncharacterized membrane protein YedE/YeeE